MKIALHPGAHRTATTSFQAYLRAHRADLVRRGLVVWTPRQTRGGLIAGGAMTLRQARATATIRGTQVLVISDENVIGSTRICLSAGCLYPDAGERLARLVDDLGGVDRIVLQVRAQSDWWPSALGYLATRGVKAPSEAWLARIARAPRGWRHVIADVARACPRTEIRITQHAHRADRPQALLAGLTDVPGLPVARSGAFALNGRTAPYQTCFTPAQSAALAEAWADDLFWLVAGAEGLATLIDADETGHTPAAIRQERGHDHEQTARRLARHG